MPKTKTIEKSNILNRVSLFGSDVESKRQEIIDYFNTSFSLYDELFSFISDEGFYIQAESLRHPLIFYLGHTATFIINKLIISGVQVKRINPDFESMFAVGVDEMSWDDINQTNYNWPKVNEVKEYRQKAKSFFNEYLEKLEFSLPINWESPMWIALMIAEHEKIHLETSAVIMRRLPLEFFKKDIDKNTIFEKWQICEEMITNIDEEKFPQNEYIEIKGTEITIGKDYSNSDYYGWDNEYGKFTTKINDFSVSKYLITNKEYFEFMKDDGYSKSEYWTEEGVKWLRFQTFNRPVFWSEDHMQLRLLLSMIPMPWDWPVEVNYLEAKAYCNWLKKKTGKYTRLITEPEWYLLRGKNEELDGNTNFNHFASPCPVNKFQHNFGVYDTFGNVWQWTESAMDEFEGFKVHPTYKDFSLPTFDGMHNLIKGGSWISTGNLSLSISRYAFRRHFYQFAGFRCIQGEEEKKENTHVERQADVTKWISSEYEMEMYQKFKINPALKTVAEDIDKYSKEFLNIKNKKRILVLGSKTGGINFELLDTYDEVYGLSQTCFYFRIPVEMMSGKTIRYEVREEGDIFTTKKINKNLDAINSQIEKGEKSIKFYQTDYCNEICPNKYGKFDAILLYMVDEKEVDGLSLLPCLSENTLVFVMTPKGKSISESQFPSNKFKKLNLINNTLNPKEHKILFRETARKHRLELYEMYIYKVENRVDANSYYETDSLCEQYIRFHFASYETFPTTCGKKCIEIMEKLNINKANYKNALDLGCAVGQTSFYLADKFKNVNGVDYSKRFIEIAKERTQMLGLQNVNFFNGSVLELNEIDLPKNNVLVFCGNLIDRVENPYIFLKDIANYVEKGGLLILTSPYTWLENFTPKENWVGGYVTNAEIMTTLKGLEIALKDDFELHSYEDVEFLIPDTPPFMYQLTSAHMTVWIRK
jgi:5-histidylcysteine sulfoxide synthase